MKNRKSAILFCAIYFFVHIIFPVYAAADITNPTLYSKLNKVSSSEFNKFEILTSQGLLDASKAIDGNYVTRATTKSYNGIPIFDVNGNKGSDYILLFTLSLNEITKFEKIKWNYEFGTPFWDGTYYTNGGGSYLGETVIPWVEGLDIFTSNTANTDDWTKVYSKESMKGELLTEQRPEKFWDSSNGLRTYYDIGLDKEAEGKYVRIAVKAVKPWLGAINIPEIELYGKSKTESEQKTENVQTYSEPLKMVSVSVDGGSEISKDIVPVITYSFNNSVKEIDRSMVLVNGKENTGLVQHAYTDAVDDSKVHISLYADKLDNDCSYTVELKNTNITGDTAITFTTSSDYTDGVLFNKSETFSSTNQTEDISLDSRYDVYNEKNSVWEQIPIVSQKQRSMGLLGGEGGQWMQAIECDSEDGQLLFAGVDIGAFVRSTDGGKTWHRSHRGFNAMGCVDFEIDPNNKNRVLAVGSMGNVPENGIYLSEDMGETWSHVHSYLFGGQRDTRKQLAWDKSSYDEEIGGSRIGYWSNLYRLSANNEGSDEVTEELPSDRQGGLYKTTDGGKTWFCVNDKMSDSVVEVNPADGTVYIGNESGFFRSTDGGVTFTHILSDEPIYGLDVINTRPDNVYINDSHGVLVSADKGQTFERIAASGFPAKSDLSDVRNIPRDLAVSPVNPQNMILDDRDYINYNNHIYYSADGGKTWKESAYDKSKDFFYCHNRQHAFAWHPKEENKVWSLGGDWITSSADGGKNFAWDANGYCGTPPGGRFTFNPFNPELMLLPAQDLLGAFSKNGGHTWEALDLTEKWGFGCAYGGIALDENLMVISMADGWNEQRQLKVSRDGGKTFEGDLILGAGWERRRRTFFLSPKNENTIFAGEYVSHDRAETWSNQDGCEAVLAINTYHNKEVYGFRHNGSEEIVVVSYDDGYTWYPFSKTYVDDMFVTREGTFSTSPHMWDIEYDGVNEILYYMQGNINTGSTLVRVEDNKHTNIGNNLQAQSVGGSKYMHCMAIDPREPDILYVGSYGSGNISVMTGVQRSCDRGESFQVISSMGDEKSVVRNGPSAGGGAESLAVHPETGEVWVWSTAEGLWKFPPPYSQSVQTIEIRTIEDIKNIDVNNSRGKYYKLMNDIDLKNGDGYGWIEKPLVGEYDTENGGEYFLGTFDGNGHVIKNFTLNCTQTNDNNFHGAYGIFSAIGGNAVIKNLGIENADIRMGSDWIYISSGAIAGAVLENAKISNCYVKNIKSRQDYPDGLYSCNGGMVGLLRSGIGSSGNYHACIENCYSLNFEKGVNTNNVGGIVGLISSADDVVKNCYTDTFVGVCSAEESPMIENVYYDDDMSKTWPGRYDNELYWGKSGYIGTNVNDVKELSADSLGDKYLADERNQNGGYPVLTWEYETSKLSGEGRKDKPYLISSKEDFKILSDEIANSKYCGNGVYYKLTEDIDYNGEMPVMTGSKEKPFKGIFDGGNHTIRNFNVNLTGGETEGLFPYVMGSGMIYNLGVENVSAYLGENVWGTSFGALAGEAGENAKIHDCWSKNVTLGSFSESESYFMIGSSIAAQLKDNAAVYNCYSLNQTVYGEVDYKGSVVGKTEGSEVSIYNCYSDTATVRFEPSSGEWNNNLYDIYYPENITLPWPWEYYSTGKATGYIGQAVPEEELKKVPDNLQNAFSVDREYINDGYPVLKWQSDIKINTKLSAAGTDADGNITEINNAEKLKSVKLTGTPKSEGILYAAAYKNGVLNGTAVLNGIQSAGEYEIKLDLKNADTLKLFLMNYNQSPLSKTAEYILHN